MKKIGIIFSLVLLIACNNNKRRAIAGVTAYQQQQNILFKDASKSPLKKNDLKNFKELPFFPVDSSFIVTAKLTKTVNAPNFLMATNTTRMETYKEFGVLKFHLKNKEMELTVYQSQENLEDEVYKNDLYLPFTDRTSGDESYGAGRYLNIKTTDISTNGTFLINFNNTYNPYCAYNENFSCPITPPKNHLDIAINVGIKTYKSD